MAALDKHRRKLLIGTAVILIVIGSVRLYGMLTRSGAENAALTAPAAVEQTLVPEEFGPESLPPQPDEGADSGSVVAPPRQITTSPDQITTNSIPTTPAESDAGDVAAIDESEADTELTTNSIPETQAAPTAEVVAAPLGANFQLPPLPDAIGPEGLRAAAESGDVTAQFEVATRYMEGRGVAQDFGAAVAWYRAAATERFVPAQYRLGTMYEKGRGVAADPQMAQLWYTRAAEAGNRNAMHNLAVMHASGAFGEPDYTTASQWFLRAAALGLRDSQYNVAILFARGMGVQQDLEEAYRWLAIAAATGDTEAASKRDDVAAQLAPEALERAQADVAAWRPEQIIENANVVTRSPEAWGETSINPVMDGPQMIAAAQLMLNQLGFNAGPPDGLIGPRTRDAIREYQRQNSVPETGLVTPELISQLNESLT